MTGRIQSPRTLALHAHPISKVAALTSILVGLAVLTGWIFDVSVLKNVLPDRINMEVNSAISFIMLGAALWLSTLQNHGQLLATIGRAAALMVLLVSEATLMEHALDCNLGIDEFFFADCLPRSFGTPGRMSLATAVDFFMLAIAMLLLMSRSVLARQVTQFLAVASLLVATPALVGYAYGFEALHKIVPNSSMSVHTAATFLLLCVGLLYARADFGIMAPIRSPNMGGVLARQLLPAVLGVPLLLGWVRLVESRQLGEHGFEIGVTIHTVTMIIVFSVLVWSTARSMNELDSQRELARKAEDEMRILSEVDPLTGVLNRRSLCERMEREWSRSLRHGRPLAAAMFDIDFFKRINDTHGHAAGDAILQRVAMVLIQQCRPSDLICRYGGDEFCILIPETTEAGAAQLAERLCAALAHRQMHVSGQTFAVTGSFGVAERLEETDNVSSLVEQADQALLAAKQAGRNRVVRASCLGMVMNR